MKRVQRIQTLDGKLHEGVRQALHYLDVKYTEEMSRLAAQLCDYSQGNYIKTKEWLDANLNKFKKPMEIKADMLLEIEEDE